MNSTPRRGYQILHYPKLTAGIENCSSKTTHRKSYVQHANSYTKSNETSNDKHWPTEYQNRDRTTSHTRVYTSNKNVKAPGLTAKERSAVKRQRGGWERGHSRVSVLELEPLHHKLPSLIVNF